MIRTRIHLIKKEVKVTKSNKTMEEVLDHRNHFLSAILNPFKDRNGNDCVVVINPVFKSFIVLYHE